MDSHSRTPFRRPSLSSVQALYSYPGFNSRSRTTPIERKGVARAFEVSRDREAVQPLIFDSLPVSVSRPRSAKLIPDGRRRVYPGSVKVFSSLFPFSYDSTNQSTARSPCSYRTGMPMCGRLPWDHQGCWKGTRVPEGVSRNEALLFSLMAKKKCFNASSGSVCCKGQRGSVTMPQKSHRYPYINPSPAST